MNETSFQPGDKVTIFPGMEAMAFVPKLVRGRVYCVSGVFIEDSREMLGIVGVRGDRRGLFLGDTLPAFAFRLVSQCGDPRKEPS